MASWQILLVAVALGVDPDAAGSISKSNVAENSERPSTVEPGFHEYQQRISELLKRESQAKSSKTRAVAVRDLCEVHRQLVHDSRYEASDVLKEYRGRVWSRLTKIKTELKQQLARDRVNKETLDDLATMERADALSLAAAESLTSSLSLLGAAQGGPGRLLAFGGGAVPPDWGPDLVDLIERTINPAFWDVVGGPGSIYYYRPLQCLVVRATAEVHGNVGNLLGDVRKGR